MRTSEFWEKQKKLPKIYHHALEQFWINNRLEYTDKNLILDLIFKGCNE